MSQQPYYGGPQQGGYLQMPQQGYPQAPQQGPMPGYPQQMPPQGYPQQGYPQAPAQPQAMPQFNEVNDQAAAQAYSQTPVSQFGPKPNFLRVPGPQGQTRWDGSVHPGYENSVVIHLLPPWAAGKPVFQESKSHFFKSMQHPKGMVLGYAGEDSIYMAAIRLGMQSPDPRMQKMANDFGKVRRQYIYNVLDLSNPTTHYGQDGIMRPYILGAGPNLQTDIGRLADTRGGISKLVHPVSGRPLKYSKKKTGNEEMNVEYGVLDLDPAQLNPYFYPALEHLWDLEAQTAPASQEDQLKAIQSLGLPMPASGQSFAQVPQNYPGQGPQAPAPSYNPNPAPQWGSPYPGQSPLGAPPPPQGWAPQAPQSFGPPQQPQAPQWAPQAPQMPPPPQMPQQPWPQQQGASAAPQMPPPPPPPTGGYGAPPPPMGGNPGMPLTGVPMMGMQPGQGMPPPMAPPPVSSQPGGVPQNIPAPMGSPPPPPPPFTGGGVPF